MIKMILLMMVVLTNVSYASDELLTQGSVNLTFKDLDGFAMTIPDTKRAGFFKSPTRIDSTLANILNMKHIYNYVQDKNIVNFTEINNLVDKQIINMFSSELDDTHVMTKEAMFKAIRDFLILQQTYSSLQDYLQNKITDNDVIELANEEYILNKNKYSYKESRDIDYFTVIYNEDNKNEQYKKAESLKKELAKQGFKNFEDTYKSKNVDIEVVPGLINFKFNDKQQLFSDFVYKPNETGLIEDILDINSRFLVAVVNKIKPSGIKTFEEVKDKILVKLKNNKLEREFEYLMLSITKDTIDVNVEAIQSIKVRYLPENFSNIKY